MGLAHCGHPDVVWKSMCICIGMGRLLKHINPHLECLDVHSHPTKHPHKDPVSWAQVKPLEYAKQATTEQNPKIPNTNHRWGAPLKNASDPPIPHMNSNHSEGYLNPDHWICAIQWRQDASQKISVGLTALVLRTLLWFQTQIQLTHRHFYVCMRWLPSKCMKLSGSNVIRDGNFQKKIL